MRDPTDPLWPDAGERTELADVADRWRWAYHDWCLDEHRRRVLGRRSPKRLEEQVGLYLEHREGTVEPSTVQGDRKALSHLLADFGNAALARIDPQRTLDRLLREGSKPSTVRVYSAHLSGFWSWLELPYRVKLPKTQKAEARAWTDREVETLREKAEERGLLLPVDIGLYMGLRRGEIWGVEWSDLSGHTVRVRRQYPSRPLKGKRTRVAVVLPGWAHAPGSGRLCPQRRVRDQQKALRAVMEDAGIAEPGVLWHSLRHTYARMFLEAKPDLRLLQSSLGHASVTLTESTYDHLVPDRAADMAVGRTASSPTSGAPR